MQDANTQRTSKTHYPRLRGTPAVFLAYLALTAFFYAPILLGLRTFPDGDFTHHFLPFSMFQQAEWLSGRLPRWNPFMYGGHPFLADVQAAVFYPVSNLILGLTLPFTAAGARLYWLEVEAILHVVLAAFFTYLLVRDLTGSRAAAFLAGACFAFSGYLTGYPPLQLAVLRTAIWLPWLLWAFGRAFGAPRRWGWWLVAGAGLAVAWLAGHSQTFLYSAYTAGAWVALLAVLLWRREPRAASAAAGGLLLTVAVALGLSAVQWLPSLEYVQLSVRANVDYAFVSGGFPLQDSWQLLLPGVLTLYSPLYVGAVGLGLAVLSWGALAQPPVNPGRQPAVSWRAGILFFSVLAGVALLLAFGGEGFLYPLFYRFVPGWNLFRGQERAAFLVAFGLSVLAGFGMAALPAMNFRRRAWLATLYAGVAIGGVYLFGLLWQLPARTAVSQGQFLVTAAVTVLLVSTFAVLLRLPGWSRRRTGWLIALAVSNLFWANFATNVAEFGPERKAMLPPEVAALQAAVAEATTPGGVTGRVYNEFRVYEDYGLRAQVEDVWGASPLRLARYAALFEEFPLDRMWQLLGVEHVLTWRRELFVPSTLLAEFPQATDTTYLHRLAAPNPRAWFVTAARTATDEETVALLADHTFDLATVALLAPESGAPGSVPPAAPPTAAASATSAPLPTLTAKVPGELHVAVTAPQPGLVVVSENWMPGWAVENLQCGEPPAPCPAAPAAILGLPAFVPVRADLTLLAVPVPAGVVQFDLVYRPASVSWGLWISGLTLAVILGVAAWRRRQHAVGN